MLPPPSDFADLLRLCSLGKSFEGAIALAGLPRLMPLLTSTEGEAAFALAFDRDAERRPTVRVRVRARLPIQCQRCLDSMSLEVDADSLLWLVSGPDEANRLPEDVDPLLVDDARMDLRSLIEDELILAIPSAPVHRPEECAVELDGINARPEQRQVVGHGPKNPFAALADWEDDTKKHD